MLFVNFVVHDKRRLTAEMTYGESLYVTIQIVCVIEVLKKLNEVYKLQQLILSHESN